MKKILKSVSQWVFTRVITQFILTVDKNSGTLTIQPSPKVTGTLIGLATLPLILMGISLISSRMDLIAARSLVLDLTKFIRIQILLISPLTLMVLGTVIINQLHRWKGLKLFSRWESQIQYHMLMNLDLSVGNVVREHVEQVLAEA